MKHNSIMKYFLFLLLLLTIQIVNADDPPDITFEWKLTGKEILVEMADIDSKAPRGIFAIDPEVEKPVPKLLIQNAYKPEWDPNHRFFLYLDDRNIWIADKEGNAKIAFGRRFPITNLDPLDPPAKWITNGRLIYKFRFNSIGTAFLIAFNEANCMDIKDWKYKGAGKAIVSWEGTVHNPKVDLKDVMISRDIDMSPDEKQVVLQNAPFAPMDLRNNESKLYICDITFNEEESIKEDYFYSDFYLIKKLPRRLTNLGDDVCEVNPKWSPDGKWIAFTVVHLNKGYMAPAVCKPDGSEYMEILPENPSQYNGSMWYTEKGWTPAVGWDGKIEKPGYSANPYYMWGNPHASAVKWSYDGKYLLINTGDRYCTLVAAKYENNQWMWNPIGGVIGGRPTAAGIWHMALGKNSAGNPSVVYTLIDGLNIVDLTQLDQESGSRIIRWMDSNRFYIVKWLSW